MRSVIGILFGAALLFAAVTLIQATSTHTSVEAPAFQPGRGSATQVSFFTAPAEDGEFEAAAAVVPDSASFTPISAQAPFLNPCSAQGPGSPSGPCSAGSASMCSATVTNSCSVNSAVPGFCSVEFGGNGQQCSTGVAGNPCSTSLASTTCSALATDGFCSVLPGAGQKQCSAYTNGAKCSATPEATCSVPAGGGSSCSSFAPGALCSTINPGGTVTNCNQGPIFDSPVITVLKGPATGLDMSSVLIEGAAE